MGCLENPDHCIIDYCPQCILFVNFSYELFTVVNNYILNGGDIDSIELLDSGIFIPLCREACTNFVMNICDLPGKKETSDNIPSVVLKTLIYNLPLDMEERKKFAEQQSGYAVIQITREPWFKQLLDNIVAVFKH